MLKTEVPLTMDVYTHLEDEDIVKSFESLSKRGRIGVGAYTASQIVPDDDEDEGEVDWTEEADDDDEE